MKGSVELISGGIGVPDAPEDLVGNETDRRATIAPHRLPAGGSYNSETDKTRYEKLKTKTMIHWIGINEGQDRLSVPAAAGHFDVNWAFTAPGESVVGLGVEGRLVSGGVMTVSETVNYRFRVEGPKPARLLSLRRLGKDAMVFGLESEPGSVWNVETSRDVRSWRTWVQVTNVQDTLEVQVPNVRIFEAALFRAVQPVPGLPPVLLGNWGAAAPSSVFGGWKTNNAGE